MMAARGRATLGETGTASAPLRSAAACHAGAAQGDRLRAAGSVVGNRNCAVQAARSAGRESHVDSPACSGSEARTTVVRLAEVGNRGDARDAKRCRTVI